jgi:uncharacterized membrane protein YkoI
MLRSSSSRRFLVFALAVFVGLGIGLGAVIARANSGGQTGSVSHPQLAGLTAPAPTSSAPATPSSPPPAPPSPLTADQAQAVAVQASPGTVAEVEQDTEPSGLVYDVKIQHADGSESKVEVDATTGHVISVENDDSPDGNDPADAH